MQILTHRGVPALLAVAAAAITGDCPDDAGHCGADAGRRDRLRAS